MPRFWMTYESRNRLAGVTIMDSASLIGARMRVAIEGIDREAIAFLQARLRVKGY
jgi:hypothetical protein